MIGIVKASLPEGRTLSAAAALQATAALGLQGLLFNSLQDLSADLDPGELAAVRQEADRLGLYLSAQLGVVNPALPFRAGALAQAGNGDLEAGITRIVALAGAIGISEMFFLIGMIEERFQAAPDWATQCDAVVALLLRLAPVLRANGVRLLLKTHEEITTAEVVALVERVGPDVVGIAYDPVNVLCRLEDPVAAARRVAPYAAQLHIDDAIVRHEDGGIRRYLAPLGEGALDWPAITAAMPEARRWIEMHSGQFAMPIFDQDWLRLQPAIAVAEYASVLGMAQAFGGRAMPWDQTRPIDRLPIVLRKLLP